MERTLVLNATYEPLNVIVVEAGAVAVVSGKVEVLAEYDREVRSLRFTIKMPSVLRLLKYVKVRRSAYHVKFSGPTSTHGITIPANTAAGNA